MSSLLQNLSLVLSLVLAISALVPKAHAAVQGGTLVTRPAGAIDKVVITTREVTINSIIESILYSDAETPALKLIHHGDPEFPQAVTAALLELIVSLEADNFKVGSPNITETQTSLEKVKSKVSAIPGWSELEVTDAELNLSIARKVKAKKFIRFKTESTQVSITDLEAKDYFEKNKSKFGNLPFSQFRDNIKSLLAKQQLDSRLREWFEVLKKKYAVRNLEIEKKL